MTTNSYEAARSAFWDAQSAFRREAEREMQRLMPEGVATVVLEINDTPRLTVTDLLHADGSSWLDEHEDDDTFAALDQIASDMEALTWHEADSFLASKGDRFIIEKED